MDQDELGNYLLCVIAKSYEIFTKSRNQKEYESVILIHVNLLESTVMILDEISDQEQLNENDVVSGKDHAAVFEVLLEGFSKLYEAHNLHLFVVNLAQLLPKIVELLADQKLSLKKKTLRTKGIGIFIGEDRKHSWGLKMDYFSTC